MDDNILIAMLTVSIGLGTLGLFAFLWGLRTGQFDDKERFLEGALYDGEEELNIAKEMENRKFNKKSTAKDRDIV